MKAKHTPSAFLMLKAAAAAFLTLCVVSAIIHYTALDASVPLFSLFTVSGLVLMAAMDMKNSHADASVFKRRRISAAAAPTYRSAGLTLQRSSSANRQVSPARLAS